MGTTPVLASWYALPRYYDIAFQSETPAEADFLEAAFRRYAAIEVRRVLEPACGTGRLVCALARRGYRMTGFDTSRPALEYLRRRLARQKLEAHLVQADMAHFCAPLAFDAAYNTFDSFRHLLTEEEARRHLEAVAESLRPGGIYVLGFHLLPPDAAEECIERWTERRGPTAVTVTLRVLAADRRQRIERIRISLLVRQGAIARRYRDEFPLRLYTARQFRRLLATVPQWELCEVFDFWYEIDRPLRLTDELSDAVFILRRRQA